VCVQNKTCAQWCGWQCSRRLVHVYRQLRRTGGSAHQCLPIWLSVYRYGSVFNNMAQRISVYQNGSVFTNGSAHQCLPKFNQYRLTGWVTLPRLRCKKRTLCSHASAQACTFCLKVQVITPRILAPYGPVQMFLHTTY